MPSSETLEHEFTATGQSDVRYVSGRHFNVSVYGTFVGTIAIQRSFDEGVTWMDAKVFTEPFEGIGIESEIQVQYRFNCTALSSGTAYCRLGQRRN